MVTQNYQHLAPGILKLGPYGRHNNCVWLFINGEEAAVIEMPNYRAKKEAKPWLDAQELLEKVGAEAKYLLMSHAHIDHCQRLVEFRKAFPEASCVGHISQAFAPLVGRLAWAAKKDPLDIFDEVFEEEVRVLWLGSEPLILIYAPKHSQSDVLMLYRGSALTGDWFLGDLKDCNSLVYPADKIVSIKRVQAWLRKNDYEVTRAFSAHGDCLMTDIDFQDLLEKSKVDR